MCSSCFFAVHPLIKVSNQLVAAPLESDVLIQCYVEASPKAMNSWLRDSGNIFIFIHFIDNFIVGNMKFLYVFIFNLFLLRDRDTYYVNLIQNVKFNNK